MSVSDSKRRTRGDDRHVDQNVHVHLPVGDRLPNVAYLEVLFLADRRVVVLCADRGISTRVPFGR